MGALPSRAALEALRAAECCRAYCARATSKGYYSRQAVQVCIEGDIVQAQVYGLLTSPPALRRLPAKETYTLEEHRRDYNAVAHIALKQSLYLQGVAQYGHRDGVHREASVAEEALPLP